MTDLLLAAVLGASALAYVLVVMHIERRRALARAAARSAFFEAMGARMRDARRGKRVRPKVDRRIQRRRYAG